MLYPQLDWLWFFTWDLAITLCIAPCGKKSWCLFFFMANLESLFHSPFLLVDLMYIKNIKSYKQHYNMNHACLSLSYWLSNSMTVRHSGFWIYLFIFWSWIKNPPFVKAKQTKLRYRIFSSITCYRHYKIFYIYQQSEAPLKNENGNQAMTVRIYLSENNSHLYPFGKGRKYRKL